MPAFNLDLASSDGNYIPCNKMQAKLGNSPFPVRLSAGNVYRSIGCSQIVKRDNVEALSLRHNHQFRDLKGKNVLKGRTCSNVFIKELPSPQRVKSQEGVLVNCHLHDNRNRTDWKQIWEPLIRNNQRKYI
jgi:hypothetical protein